MATKTLLDKPYKICGYILQLKSTTTVPIKHSQEGKTILGFLNEEKMLIRAMKINK